MIKEAINNSGVAENYNSAVLKIDGKKVLGKTASNRIRKVIVYFFLVLYALIILVPFYIIFVTSIKTYFESLSPEFTWWPKDGVTFEAYYKLLFNDISGGGTKSALLNGFKNTLIVVLPSTVIGLLVSSLSAYAFAKINFPFKKSLFSFLLITMMIPGIIMLVPSYLLYSEMYLLDTYFPLMVPGMFGAAACVFFMRQYFYGIPTELLEAAKLDGEGHLGIFFTIMVPLSKSALIAQGVLGFVGGYNDYFGPLLYLQTPSKYTLQIALTNSIGGAYGTNFPYLMAGAIIALVPTAILYIIAQKFFIEGIATTGLKA